MATVTPSSEKLDFDKVWLMFKETDKQFKETDKKFQETREILDARSQETNKQFKETDKKLRKLETLFTGHWGKLMESLVEGDLIKLLNKRKIAVTILYTRIRGVYDSREFEFDIIAENGAEIVVVEVKTTLKVRGVNAFIDKLKSLKSMMPKYKDNKIIGAMAYLKDEEDSSIMAKNKGLFVIRATGSSASITNASDFTPRIW